MTKPSMRALLVSLVTFFGCATAFAVDGLNVSELPPGGDVTVPGDYPIFVNRAVDVLFSGLANPQSITLTSNVREGASVVRIYANHEQKVRTITLKPGSSAVYNFKTAKPVRLKVVSGDVRVKSIYPLKIQR